MSFTEYNISITTANNTIDRMHNILSDRNVPLKRDDVKEVIAQLLSFDTSKALDEKIKREQENEHFPYDERGVHKDNDNVVFKRFQTAAEAHDYLKKDNQFECIFWFDIHHEAFSGFDYRSCDFVFAATRMDVLQVLFNWKKAIHLEYVLRDDTNQPGSLNKGYWRFKVIGDELLHAIERPSYEFDVCNEDLNIPDIDKTLLEEYFLEELLESELPFSCLTKDQCEESILNWMIEDHDRARNKVRNIRMYKAFVTRFIRYFSVQRMARMEAYDGPLECLKVYNEFGLNINDPKIMLNAAAGSNDEVLGYLIKQCNDVDAFYRVDLTDTDTCAMNDQIAMYVQARDDISLGIYLKTLKDIGVDINHVDANGNTPLHFVAYMANGVVYDYFLELGADEAALNNENASPADIIAMTNKSEQSRRIFMPEL